jgi:choline-sulfatase
MMKKMRTGLKIIPVLLAMIAGLVNCREKSPSFLLETGIETSILGPENVFQKNAITGLVMRNRENRHESFSRQKQFILDLKAEGIFSWKINRDINGGSLKFKVFFSDIQLLGKNTLRQDRQLAILTVVKKGVSGSKTLISSPIGMKDVIFTPDGSSIKKAFYKIISLNRNDELLFSLDVSPELRDRLKYGITIPRIILQDPSSAQSSAPPSLILISIDTLRPDYLGIYRELAGEKPVFSFSPNIDSVARQSCIFLNAYTPQSSTWPALSSMFLSLYPHQHGVLNNGDYLKYNYYSIASFLLNRGYRTFSANGNAFQLNIPGFEEKYSFYNKDFQLINFALKKIHDLKSREPFFHWYHFLGVHANYKPAKWVMDTIDNQARKFRLFNLDKLMKSKKELHANTVSYIQELYAGELYQLDFDLKKLFDQLKNLGLWDNALVIITADHGEDLYQHNRYFYHYPSIYNTSLRVPLIIKFPGQKKQLILKEPVSLMDIFPTLVHYFTGEKSVRDYPYSLAGNSLLDLIRGDRRAFEERILYAGTGEFQIMSAHYRNWKFIFNPRELTLHTQAKTLYPIKKIELYDILNDPLETATVSNSRIANMLITLINRFRRTYPPVDIRNSIRQDQVDDETRKDAEKVLRSLGYIH